MDKTTSEKIYEVAAAHLGQHLSGNIPVVGCALTVNKIGELATGLPFGGGSSTVAMEDCLEANTARFKEVNRDYALNTPGVIIISASRNGNGNLRNGHVGVIAKHGIISNSSEDGLLHEYWTIDKWDQFYGVYGGYQIRFFEVLY